MTDYKAVDFGAKGDDSHDDTTAIQAAIDRCYADEWGRVVLSSGKVYNCGSIVLRSNADLLWRSELFESECGCKSISSA